METIVPNEVYTPPEIARNGWIKNTKNKPSHHFVLEEIKSGRLKGTRVGKVGGKFVVSGNEILRYRKEVYGEQN